jgi:hypothetical protein
MQKDHQAQLTIAAILFHFAPTRSEQLFMEIIDADSLPDVQPDRWVGLETFLSFFIAVRIAAMA